MHAVASRLYGLPLARAKNISREHDGDDSGAAGDMMGEAAARRLLARKSFDIYFSR